MQAETGIGAGKGIPEIDSLGDATSRGSHPEHREEPAAQTSCGKSRKIAKTEVGNCCLNMILQRRAVPKAVVAPARLSALRWQQ